MALTLDRWIAALVAGCLVAVVLVAGPRAYWNSRGRYNQGRREILADRERQTGYAYRIATNRIHMKELRDSVIAALAKVPRADTTRLVVSEHVTKRAQVVRSLSARLANALPSRPVVGVDMVVSADTFSRGSTRSAYNYQLLPSTTSDRCVAISAALATRDIGARDWIGPCGFYATFGMPGANIDRWLSAGGWVYGARWGSSLQLVASEWENWWYAESVPWRDESGFFVRRFLSPQGYSCLTGNTVLCRSLVLDPMANDQSNEWYNYRAFRDAIRLGNHTVWTRPGGLRWAGLLGPEMQSLLMDMSTSLGRDKFTRFWKSDLPPADAFRAAAGQDIEVWTLAWMRTTYGEYGRGPGVRPWGAALGILMGLLALGGASVTWRRRQVA